MRKFLSVFILVAVTAGGYLFGAVWATAANHDVTPSASANAVAEGSDGGTNPIGITLHTSPLEEINDVVTVDVTCIDGTAKRGTGLDNDYACNTAGTKLTLDSDGSTE